MTDEGLTTGCFIELKDIVRSFPEGLHRHPVLQGVSLTIGRGETVALLGRSGSGKSTLLNIISGIDRPDRGSVLVDGFDLMSMNETARTLFRRRHIGFIYQFFNLVPSLTAAENIALVLELNGISVQETALRTTDILEQIGLATKGHLFPSQLSGGEQQRVAMAKALVHYPKIVLADEPTGNLDAHTGHAMLRVLGDLLAKNSSAMLLVTHSLAVAKTADRIVTLEDGILAERDGDFAW
ncbi:MAG: ABC transporter ATP-binding protein [Pseudomonadales bacterium]|nr:ABC transporter ATP-binding protein [Pseudomonadales bacterium]